MQRKVSKVFHGTIDANKEALFLRSFMVYIVVKWSDLQASLPQLVTVTNYLTRLIPNFSQT